jgi:hypothetical protein
MYIRNERLLPFPGKLEKPLNGQFGFKNDVDVILAKFDILSAKFHI